MTCALDDTDSCTGARSYYLVCLTLFVFYLTFLGALARLFVDPDFGCATRMSYFYVFDQQNDNPIVAGSIDQAANWCRQRNAQLYSRHLMTEQCFRKAATGLSPGPATERRFPSDSDTQHHPFGFNVLCQRKHGHMCGTHAPHHLACDLRKPCFDTMPLFLLTKSRLKSFFRPSQIKTKTCCHRHC